MEKKILKRNSGWNFPLLVKTISLQIRKLRELLIHGTIRTKLKNIIVGERKADIEIHIDEFIYMIS